MNFKDKKNLANELGRFAEEKVSDEYLKRGYAILERNWRLGKTEIDIIAQKDDILVLIEVKARSGRNEDALDSVTADKRRRMVKAADSYLRRLEGQLDYRFDIATFTGDIENHTIEIFEDAFLSADLY